MATRSVPRIDFAELQRKLTSQFRGLDPNDPSSWPLIPRLAVCIGLSVAVVVVLWFVWISSSADELEAEQQKEVKLRDDFTQKLGQAINLEALRKQREQVQQYVTQLEKQLPSKAEMDALLSDINQAGLGRSLYFELFRPGTVNVKEYYAELPIALRVTGKYHDVGSFASDIAHLSRIVTLNNIAIVPQPNGSGLIMEASARTYRYLDPEEVSAQRKVAGPGPKK